MKYCSRCVLPDTRPNLVIGEDGVCNACKSHGSKDEGIDWGVREQNFQQVVDNARKRSKGYDCLIPVSGGKDSHWQVVKCLEYGLNPLCLTWKSHGRTPLGQHNLDRLIDLGVDHVDYGINQKVEKRFYLESIRRFGNPGLPMHMGIFNITLRTAAQYEIPLVVWGENSAFEYGSPEEAYTGFKLDSEWLKRFGVMNGTIAEDWTDFGFTMAEMTPYRRPSDEVMNQIGVNAVFLGYYFKWDPEETVAIARANGFKSCEDGAKVGLYDYADIDDDFISVHHWFKWYKFGFTRVFDNLSIEIRNGRISRDEALDVLREKGREHPVEDIQKFCDYMEISTDEFFSISEKFRNTDIWYEDQGQWKIKDFIFADWDWSQ